MKLPKHYGVSKKVSAVKMDDRMCSDARLEERLYSLQQGPSDIIKSQGAVYFSLY